MDGVCPGSRVGVCWADGEDFQDRIVLTKCTADEYEEVLGLAAPQPPAGAQTSRLWYCLTPDGDVYPHALQSPPLHSVVLIGATGRPVRASQ